MGDTIKPEGTGRQINALSRYLPNYLRAVGENVAPFEQSLLNSRASIDPQNLALDESLLRYFGPRLNQIGSDIQGQNAMNQAQNELNVIEGPGADLVAAGRQLDQMQDPEYYAARAMGADKFIDLMRGQDPNKLTGAEVANVERGINRVDNANGTANVGGASKLLQHGMTFGDELNKKRGVLLDTLDSLPQNLAAFKSGKDVFQVATGRPSYGANPGQGQFTTGRQGFGANVSTMAGGLLGESGQNVRQNNDLTANARDGLDRATQLMSSMPSD